MYSGIVVPKYLVYNVANIFLKATKNGGIDIIKKTQY